MNQFSLHFPEYHIANQLQKDFPKAKNYSVSIPYSRQQKYYDLLLHNANNKKCLTIQIKSSRTYPFPEPKPDWFNYYSWFHRFDTDIYTDFYFLFISFHLFDTKTFTPRAAFGTKLLVFNNKEMKFLLNNITRTKSGSRDSFFSFGFNIGENKIFGDRGFKSAKEFTDSLYENKIGALRKAIK